MIFFILLPKIIQLLIDFILLIYIGYQRQIYYQFYNFIVKEFLDI